MPSRIVRSAVLLSAVLLCSAVSGRAPAAIAPAAATAPAAAPAAEAGAATGAPVWTAAASGAGSGQGDDGRPYFYLEGAPGSVLQDTLALTNPGKRPVTLRLRGAEAYNTASGSFAVRATDDPWITPATRTVRIPARTRAEVPFSVTLPVTAEPGDHVAEMVATGGGHRAGVRIRLRVSGPTLSALTVEDVRVDEDHGTIHYAVVNRGNTVLTPRLAVHADGVFGRVLSRAPRTLPVELMPGQRVRRTEGWSDAPALGPVTVHLTATAAGGAHGEGTASAVFVPWAPVAGAGLVVLGVAVWLVRRRRRRTPGEGAAGVSPAALVCLIAVCALTLLPATAGIATATGKPTAATGKPTATLSKQEAGKGGDITVRGKAWRPGALLMMLICGQSAPGRGVIGGTNSCANADGRAVTTDAQGRFSRKLPVAEPPTPCPCVVHIATVTGEQAAVDVEFKVAGHPVTALPKATKDGRLAVLTAPRLEGSSGVLTWFGAPPTRSIVFTVGNLGPAPVKDPVFSLGTSHGVYAPQWEDRQWHGTIEPGRKARITLDTELAAGAHGDYTVAVKYGGKVLIEQPWGVGRPWGVTFFWLLLCVVVPAAVFRIGMAIVDRVRPRRSRTARSAAFRRWRPVSQPPPAEPHPPTATALPWFTPDTAPSENHPTTKGHS